MFKATKSKICQIYVITILYLSIQILSLLNMPNFLSKIVYHQSKKGYKTLP